MSEFDIRNTDLKETEKEFERALRPLNFGDFQGQKKIVENLEIFVRAAKMRGESLDHVILHGPPGLGKTTLSAIIANELGVGIKITSGPVLDKPGDLAGLLTNLEENDVLFIDEIHRLSPVVEEYLYSAMEDYRIDIMIDKGPAARSVQIQINPFTLIGATTRSGLLTAPLRARFGINCHLEYYDTDILSGIISRSAAILNVGITGQAAMEIASRSRGTPRIANALLRRVRDFAMVKGNGSIDRDITRYALEALNIDKYGLDEMDNKILLTIIEKFKGGPVGLTTIATAVGEDAGTLEEVYQMFNLDHPEGYRGRSLSVSDVVEVVGEEKSTFHFCDSIGFREVDFDPDMTEPLKEKKIKVVLCEPGKVARVAEIGTELSDLQKVVGGLIEPYYPFEEQVCIVCNDEGKYNGMRPCRAIYGEDREMMDIIFGPFFICDCSTPYFGSLNKEQLERYKKQFQNPEHFFRVGGEIKAVPYKPEKDHER